MFYKELFDMVENIFEHFYSNEFKNNSFKRLILK